MYGLLGDIPHLIIFLYNSVVDSSTICPLLCHKKVSVYLLLFLIPNGIKPWLDDILECVQLSHWWFLLKFYIGDQNYLYISISVKKKISIAKIRTNSHELHRKNGIKKILKHCVLKEFVIFVTLRGLKMKNTFLHNVLHAPTIHHNFKIFATILTLLTFQLIKTIVI
jgi:hypothetical protein